MFTCLENTIICYEGPYGTLFRVKSFYIHNWNTLTQTTEKWYTMIHIHNWKACINTSETFYMDYWNAFAHTCKMFPYTQCPTRNRKAFQLNKKAFQLNRKAFHLHRKVTPACSTEMPYFSTEMPSIFTEILTHMSENLSHTCLRFSV